MGLIFKREHKIITFLRKSLSSQSEVLRNFFVAILQARVRKLYEHLIKHENEGVTKFEDIWKVYTETCDFYEHKMGKYNNPDSSKIPEQSEFNRMFKYSNIIDHSTIQNTPQKNEAAFLILFGTSNQVNKKFVLKIEKI